MVSRWLIFLSIVLGVAARPAAADVSLRNGNFFVSFRDISYTGGFGMKIERIYNSKSDFKGMFGYGWGIEYETSLQVLGDGSVVISEFGGGGSNVFLPEHQAEANIQREIDQIVAAVVQRGDITGTENLDSYRLKLKGKYARVEQWRKYQKLGLLEPGPIPVGTRLISHDYESQEVVVLRDGFRRTQPESGQTQFFDRKGRLRQIVNVRGNFLLLSYDIPHQITMRDDIGQEMVLTEDERGLVTRIDGSGGKTALFRYSAQGMLIYCKDDVGIENTFDYTHDVYLNLSQIAYLNDHNKTMDITYYPPELYCSVKSVQNPDGTLNEYEYVIKHEEGYYKARVVESSATDAGGKRKVLKDSVFEYFSALGDSWFTKKMISTVNGKQTISTYTDFGYPERTAGPDGSIEYKYDKQQREILRTTPNLLVETAYDDKIGRINQLTYTELPSQHKTRFNFSYDEKGLLTAASRDSVHLQLKRDSLGRIAEIDSADGHALHLVFDAGDAPSSVEAERAAAQHADPMQIDVSYTEGGSIGHVASKQGTAAARLITAELADWISIVNTSIVGCEMEPLHPVVPKLPSTQAGTSNEDLLKGARTTLAQVR